MVLLTLLWVILLLTVLVLVPIILLMWRERGKGSARLFSLTRAFALVHPTRRLGTESRARYWAPGRQQHRGRRPRAQGCTPELWGTAGAGALNVSPKAKVLPVPPQGPPLPCLQRDVEMGLLLTPRSRGPAPPKSALLTPPGLGLLHQISCRPLSPPNLCSDQPSCTPLVVSLSLSVCCTCAMSHDPADLPSQHPRH